jgi:two-component system, OmpR family, alkaline phosphatase synthesis response regulator PhoP
MPPETSRTGATPTAPPSEIRLLFVEDEINLQRSLAYILKKEGFAVTAVRTGEEAIEAFRAHRPDLLLLDLGLPGIDGYEVCRALRREPSTAAVPVIMLTGRGLPNDIVRGLKEYADDYVVKPCDPEVLIARVRAVLRRNGRAPERTPEPLTFGTLSLDPLSREARLEGRPVALTRTEFDILALLAGTPNRVFSRGQIIDRVRGDDYAITERTVDFQVCGLRRKLGPDGARIETVRGLGYKFLP